ncbi:DUF2695 domain-containing protein [Pseudonocardia nantongensis]|uniref:DUF2695 domain-containing protein n=1 Tax=Pseudonocardia nantongensis TaxID=1181885 RepID=UPI00397CF085
MTIDDIARPSGRSVELWRGVLHDMIDEVLDRILEAAGDAPDLGVDDRPDDDRLDHELPGDELLDDEWPDDEVEEPPGARPSVEEIAGTGTRLRSSLGAALDRGTRFWGCDGTLRCTRAWAERFGVLPDRVADNFRRSGLHCDCAVMRGFLGRTDLPRCALRSPSPSQRGPATS